MCSPPVLKLFRVICERIKAWWGLLEELKEIEIKSTSWLLGEKKNIELEMWINGDH